MTKTLTSFDDAKEIFVGGVNSPVRAYNAVGGAPVFIRSGKGAIVTDEDDKRYIDYVLSYGPLLAGHANDAVIADLHNAIIKGTTYGAPTTRETKLGKALRQFFPSMEKLRFVNSGTEATMSAIRLARGATKRHLIVKFEGCYHGHVDSLLVAAGSGALTLGKPSSMGIPEDITKNTRVLPYNNVAALSQLFESEGSQIAAIIMEPVCGNMGVIKASQTFLDACRKLTKAHGALLIFDEVMTGFRAGKNGAQEALNVTPDLTCLGKVIGGGLPCAAYGGKTEIMNHLAPLGDVYQAGTLSGNPLAITAGLSMIDLVNDYHVYDKAEAQTERLLSGIQSVINDKKAPVTINGIGTMFTLFFTEKKVECLADVNSCNFDMFKAYFHFMKDHGILLPPSQYEANFVSSEHHNDLIDQTIDTFSKFLDYYDY